MERGPSKFDPDPLPVAIWLPSVALLPEPTKYLRLAPDVGSSKYLPPKLHSSGSQILAFNHPRRDVRLKRWGVGLSHAESLIFDRNARNCPLAGPGKGFSAWANMELI